METEKVIGRTVKKKFFAALFCGFLLLASLIGVFGMTGTAFALPMGGIGDFYVTFDKLEGTGFQFIPHVGENGNSDAAPMVRNVIDEATVYNLHIYKDIKLPNGQWIRINIRGTKPTEIKGLIQDARFINANLAFDNLAIQEKNTNDFTKNWTQKADKIHITDAKIVTDYLFQTMVNLQGTKIYVEKIDKPDTSSEK